VKTLNSNGLLVSIIIPVYNEEGSLPQLIGELDHVIRSVHHPLEVIFVNDVSTDESPVILDRFEKEYDYVRVIHLLKKGGQTGCYQVAFQEANGKYIIRMDSDLQDDPADLHQFFALIEQDVDLIMGLREIRRHKRLLRFASILYDSFVVLLFDTPLHTNTSSFVAFKSKFVRGIQFVKNDHRYIPVISMLRGATKIKEVVIVNRERKYGISKYSNVKKIIYGIPEVIRFFIRAKMGYYNSYPVEEES
jgi:glycosyltransferase involved in cell wall biosynthesis